MMMMMMMMMKLGFRIFNLIQSFSLLKQLYVSQKIFMKLNLRMRSFKVRLFETKTSTLASIRISNIQFTKCVTLKAGDLVT